DAPVYAGALRGGAAVPPRRPAGGAIHRRRSPERASRAVGVSLPPALPVGDGGLLSGRADLAAARGRRRGRLSSLPAAGTNRKESWRMKFGIHIGHMGGPLDEMRRLWKFADTKGFDWFSVSDHFQESPPRGGDMDCYEAIATLTAAAMDTTRIRLGSGVYCVAYRNPGLLAKSLTTIDHLSHGRVDCGLGAGWHGLE